MDEQLIEERRLLLLGATLWVGGLVLGQVAALFHASPPGGDANDLVAVFPGIAASSLWGAAHLGQFAAATIVIAGLLVLLRALQPPTQTSVLGMLGAAAAIGAGSASAMWLAWTGSPSSMPLMPGPLLPPLNKRVPSKMRGSCECWSGQRPATGPYWKG